MSNQQSVERHLIVVLGAIACIAVLGVLAILPYRLYMRDIRQAYRIVGTSPNFTDANTPASA